MKNKVYRILDANFNRAREGLRVCEEVTRLALSDPRLTKMLKTARHQITSMASSLMKKGHDIIRSRNSIKDIGAFTRELKSKRSDYKDVFMANVQRAKESIRVLEEFSKVVDKKLPAGFKKLRFQVYEMEKKGFERLSALRRRR